MRSTLETVLLSGIILIIMLGGIVDNLLVLLAIMSSRSMKNKPSSLLLRNLALSDLILATLAQPYQLAALVKSSLIEDNGLLCQIGGIASYLLFIVSVGTRVGMCVDRFYALAKPLLYRVRVTFKVAWGMPIYPWVHAVIFGIGTGFGIGARYDSKSKDCGLDWKRRHIAFTLFVMLTHVAIPFIVILVSNILIVRRLRSHDETFLRLRRNQVTESSSVSLNMPRNQDLEGKYIYIGFALTNKNTAGDAGEILTCMFLILFDL